MVYLDKGTAFSYSQYVGEEGFSIEVILKYAACLWMA